MMRWQRDKRSGLILPRGVDSFMPNGMRMASIGRDSIAYATWNPSDCHPDLSLSGGNLIVTLNSTASGWRTVRATQALTAGQWYWEVKINALMHPYSEMVGVHDADDSLSNHTGQSGTGGMGYYSWGGRTYRAGVLSVYGAAFVSGDVIGVALDMDSRKIWWSLNGVWQGGGDPAAGLNPGYSSLPALLYPAVCQNAYGSQMTANFGATPFAYSVPSGFNAGVY